MINYTKLRGKLAEAGISKLELSRKMMMSPTTIYRKINGSAVMTLPEMESIILICNQAKENIFTKEEAIEIFFDKVLT